VRGETFILKVNAKDIDISIHSPRAGRDTQSSITLSYFINFNPLSPCGERLDFVHVPAVFDEISIHSPRAGRDSKK